MKRVIIALGVSVLLIGSLTIDAKGSLTIDAKNPKKNVPTSSKKDGKPTKQEVKEYIRVLGLVDATRQSLKKSGPQVIQMYADKFDQYAQSAGMKSGWLDKKEFKKFMYGAHNKLLADVHELEAVWVDLFRKYYTRQDLHHILAFYKTPTGQKVLRILPQFTAECSVISQEWSINKMTDYVSKHPQIKEMLEKTTKKDPKISSRTFTDQKNHRKNGKLLKS